MTESINAFLRDGWQPTLALITAIGATIGYFITHRRELSWKRTEFISSQLKYLGDDPKLFEMLKILEKRHPTISIDGIYGNEKPLNSEARAEYQHEFDRFLNYIWCLCFAYLNLKTLTNREIVCIGRYLSLIIQHPSLVTYCEDHGYRRIIIVAEKLGYEKAFNT